MLLIPSITYAVELGDSPDQKPPGCTTEFYDARCATFSTGGYSMWIWTGAKGKEITSKKYNFVGTTDFKTMWTGDIGTYVYKQDGEDFYYAIKSIGPLDVMTGFANLVITHHYRSGKNSRWDEFAMGNDTYKAYAIKGDALSLPPYKNSFQTINGQQKRFVWRVVATGKITLNGKEINESGSQDRAIVKIKIVSDNGPALSQVSSDTGGNYDFSSSGLFNDQKFWISTNTISKVIIYTQLEKNGADKYEVYKEFDFPGNFRVHSSHDDTLVLNEDRDINLTEANKVTSFSEAKGGEQNISEETFGEDDCGTMSDLNIAKVIARAFCGIGLMLHDAASTFLTYSINKLKEVIGVGEY